MNIIINQDNFNIVNLILSQKEYFTVEDIFLKAKNVSKNATLELIQFILQQLNDVGLIRDYGAKYSLSNILRLSI